LNFKKQSIELPSDMRLHCSSYERELPDAVFGVKGHQIIFPQFSNEKFKQRE
jgi:hypothetical protein